MLELNAGAIEMLELLFFFFCELRVLFMDSQLRTIQYDCVICLCSMPHPHFLFLSLISTASSLIFVIQLTNYGVENIIGDVIFIHLATCQAKHL